MDLKAVLRVAVAAASDAVEVQRAHLGRVAHDEWAEKGEHDFVTRVDREAESKAIDRIRRAFPEHAILSEEEATAASPVAAAGPEFSGSASVPGTQDNALANRLEALRRQPGWLWVIDPLDGTTNYLHRYPMYSASVAALQDGRVMAGAVIHGVTGETWSAVRGGGAFLDGQRITVSATDRMRQALIGTGFPFKALELLPAYLQQFQRVIRRSAGIRRTGSAALDLCHVASGYFDGFWELWLAPWDVAAGMLIVREAGGVVTRIDGGDDVLFAGSLLAGNPRIHADLTAIVKGESE
jgi:myo-inositol-1(or 4)-monophosphatase